MKILEELNDKQVYRFCLFSVLIMLGGSQTDRLWHGVYPIREFYFIIPHIIMYVGIVGVMLGFLILKLKKHNVPILLFVLFPIFSMFDNFWHGYFGVELFTSPLAFWSPAHWSLFMVFEYVAYELYKTKIDDNKFMLLLNKVIVFFLPIKGIYYVLVPLSPFTRYGELVNNFNILTAVFSILIIFTMHKIFEDREVTFVSLLFLYINTSSTNFLQHSNFIYKNPGMTLVFFFFIMCFLLFGKVEEKYYYYISYLTIFWIFLMDFLAYSRFSIYYFIFSLVVTTAFVPLYIYAEEFLLKKFEKQILKFQEIMK